MPEHSGESEKKQDTYKLQELDTITAGDEVLTRARFVAKRIAEKVRKLTGDTKPDHSALPDNPTLEQPPLG